jgi:hypothetical protein
MSDGTPTDYYIARLWLEDYGAVPYLFVSGLGLIDPIPIESNPSATIRLPNTCPTCGDTYPDGAQFCISCGAHR